MKKIPNEIETSSFSDGQAGSLLEDEMVASTVRKTLNFIAEMLSGMIFLF